MVALHLAVFVLGKRGRRYSGVTAAIAAEEAARVGQHLAAGGNVEAASVRIGDARVGSECGGFGPACPFNALRAVERVDIVEVEMQVAGHGTEFSSLRKPTARVIFGDFGESHCALNCLADALGGQVARRG